VVEDLCFNKRAAFTRWVTRESLLREPLVVVDVGVQGGASLRWDLLGDHLVLHGFDAIAEVVADLQERNSGRTNRHFHHLALGAADGESDFYFNPANPFSSSMVRPGQNRFDSKSGDEVRKVTVRRLDTLFAQGMIPRCDFLKVDVEGFEKDVFVGTRKLLAAGVLAVETETSFDISPAYPGGHFTTITELLLPHHLLLFDLGFNRVARASFRRALMRKGLADEPGADMLGRPATFNVLYCRDLIDETDHPDNYAAPPPPVSLDQMIKVMIILELHGLNDIALDTAERFADALGTRLDVERAVDLLADPACRENASDLQRQLRAFEQSTSWRITAPLRGLKRAFQRAASSE